MTFQGGLNNDESVDSETAENVDVSRLLTPGEAAGRLGVATRTLADWDRAGKIRARRLAGGHRRYPESEVTALAMMRADEAAA